MTYMFHFGSQGPIDVSLTNKILHIEVQNVIIF